MKPYTATLKVFGKTYTSEGDTVSECISNLKPGNAKGKAILSITKDGKTKDRVLTPFNSFRLFNSHGLMREVNLKNATILFDGI